MASDRRRGGESAAMRAELVDAAEQLIREQGYPAVTSRTLAHKVNLKRQIVHYYFASMDEVFIAVVHKAADRMRARIEEAIGSEDPLRELDALNRDPAEAVLSMELNALASRRPAIRAEVARVRSELRQLQTDILARLLADRGARPVMHPVVAIVLLTSLAQFLASETAIDVSIGHAETLEFVDECLRAFEEGRATLFGPADASLRLLKSDAEG